MRFASAKIVMVLLAGGAGLPAVATVFNRGSVHAAAVVTLGQATDGFSTGPSMTTMAGTIGSISSGSLTEGPYRASASHSVNAT